MKKLFAILLCLALILPAFPVFARETGEQTEETLPETTEPGAQTQESEALEALRQLLPTAKPKTEAQRIRKQIIQTHITSLEKTGHETLGGRCGLQVSWELYLLGINKHLETYDGNKHYDHYSTLKTTTGGYSVKAYSAETHSLLEALNSVTANGTRDVYNLMACFEKTDTEAGQIYGHVCFIHAILDGMVYCTEGFATRWGTIEGEPVVITIDQFDQWFSDWTEYEGLVYFGTKDPLHSYTYYPCDSFVQSTKEQDIYTSPDKRFGALTRVAAMGERLRATGIYEDMEGQLYYRVDDDGQTGYVLASDWKQLMSCYDSVTYTDPVLPEKLEQGKAFKPGGKITSGNLQFTSVSVKITDAQGKTVKDIPLMQEGTVCDLNKSKLQKAVDLKDLPQGVYYYSIYAQVQNHYLSDGLVQSQEQTLCLANAGFAVGEVAVPEPIQPVQPKQMTEGWTYEQGKWYYYADGKPVTGWLRYEGLDYYLDENGAAVTGWQEINGQKRYFSNTGAMRTGWISNDAGVGYRMRNGVAVTGWRMIDGAKYCFDEQGMILCGGWTKLESGWYYFKADGKAATGWVELDGVHYSFHADGYLLAKRQTDGEQTKMIPYDGTWEPEK